VDVVVKAVAVEAQLGKKPIHQMVSMCARETTCGHVMMWAFIIALIKVVFHVPHVRGLNTEPSFTKGKLPLTVTQAPCKFHCT
jgi:hypothetical protein